MTRGAVFRGAAVAIVSSVAAARALLAQSEHPAGIPADVSVQFVPPVIAAEDGRHLMYELHIMNFGAAELSLQRIDVLNDTGGQLLVSYSGDSLEDIIARPGTRALQNKRTIGAGLTAVAFIDVRFPGAGALPTRARHRLTFAPIKPPNGPVQSIVEGAPIVVPRNQTKPFGPPVRGSGWLASHGLSNASSHRRTLLAIDGRARIAQRFAIDWTRIGDDGQVFRGDPAKNSNWSPYGADVLAIASGRVVAIQDGIPENDPTADKKAVDITLQTVGGNYLILDLGDGRFAFYAHLQPRSFKVRAGDRVKQSQVLAKLGNSGQSDAPHLHLHIMNAPSPLAAEGLPLTFKRFELLGHVTSLRVLSDGSGWRSTSEPVLRSDEMPLENSVLRF